MAVKIRLTRMGAKKRPTYRVVATDSRARRDGEYLEQIGFYDPNQNPAIVNIDNTKAIDWLKKGAVPTDTAKSLLSKAGVMKAYHEERSAK